MTSLSPIHPLRHAARRLRWQGLLAALALLLAAGIPAAGPVAAGGATPDVVQVDLGLSHACARKADLSLWCWGRNDYRQLGDYTSVAKTRPVRSRITQVIDVAAGFYHTCALRTDATIWCVGRNTNGQLGDGTTQPRNLARRVQLPAWEADPVDVTSLGNKTCARLADDGIYCWPGAVLAPTKVTFGDQVSAGPNHSCATRFEEDITVCWGANNEWQLGDGTNIDSSVPELVDAGGTLRDVRQVMAGDGFTCARKVDYRVWCWGSNSYGKLGYGTYGFGGASRHRVVNLTDAREIAVGTHHACARTGDRKAFCWGSNESDQLGFPGNTTTGSSNRPGRVRGLTDVVEIDAGGGSSLAMGEAGYARGFTCARKLDRTVWCWGENKRGQLGDGTRTQRDRPVKVAFP